MMNRIKVIFFIASLLLIESCYTTLPQRKREYSGYINQTEFPQNSVLKNTLTGVWINRRLLIDYGYQYRRLEINRDGRVVYIPDSERSNSKIYYGDYRVLKDTLIISFERKNYTEWMRYRLNADTLFIYNIKEREGTGNNLVNDCYNCVRRWLKTQ